MFRPADALMRQMSYKRMPKVIVLAMAGSGAIGLSHYWGIVHPKYVKYTEFFNNVEPYKVLEDICRRNKGSFHSCPDQLAKRFAEKGLSVPK